MKYRCYQCGGDFETDPNWTEEHAKFEAENNGFDFNKDDMELVCDECFKEIQARHPHIKGLKLV